MSENYPWQENKAFFDVLRLVQKPGRYTGGEWNSWRKDPHQAKTKIALAFPDAYEVGMSYLGQKILYEIINSQPDLLAERVFAPWPDMEAELRRRGWPLFTLENRLPLRSFDIVGFSLLYELNYSNILTILDLGQIPFRAEARDETAPLVIAGGPGAFNPEPLAPFFDLFLLGDGEEAILEIIRTYQKLRKEGMNRRSLLKHLASVEGVYVPLFYEARRGGRSSLLTVKPKEDVPQIISKRILRQFDQAPFPISIIVPNIEIIHDRVAVEVARGCPQKCRFCQATSLYFPFRFRHPQKVLETTLSSLKSTGYEDASLMALSIGDYPYFDELIQALMVELEKRCISLSLSSLRPSGLTAEAVRNIGRVRKTGFTIVPEAGSERLRQVINKNLSEPEVLRAAELAFKHGWRILKLYFMFGLPTETKEDLDGIVKLTEEILTLGRKILRRPPLINLSLSPFIPKPHTPFQWLAMSRRQELEEKLAYLKSQLRRLPSVKVKDRSVEMAQLEAIFSRGDRRLADVLERAWRNGARFDSWGDRLQWPLWEESFNSLGLSIQDYLSSFDLAAELPWDHCHLGIEKEYLKKELAKALRGETTPSCLDNKCRECLGCSAPELFKPKLSEASAWKIPRPNNSIKRAKPIQPTFRYLVFYEKAGEARFLGHLDFMRAISRVLRRGGVPVAFSEGFHPKIKLSFPPPLPLGMEGYRECFEFKSLEPLESGAFLNATNDLLPKGVRFIELRVIPGKAPALAERLEAAVYSLSLTYLRVNEELKENSISDDPIFLWLQEKVKEVAPSLDPRIRAWLSAPLNKLFLRFPVAGGGLRPQDFLQQHLGLEGMAFYLAREGFIFKEEKEN